MPYSYAKIRRETPRNVERTWEPATTSGVSPAFCVLANASNTIFSCHEKGKDTGMYRECDVIDTVHIPDSNLSCENADPGYHLRYASVAVSD